MRRMRNISQGPYAHASAYLIVMTVSFKKATATPKIKAPLFLLVIAKFMDLYTSIQ
jgi:hypothetical protein